MSAASLTVLLPEAAILVSALLTLLVGVLPRARGREAAWIGFAGALAGAALALIAGRGTLQAGDALFAVDGTAVFARVATCMILALYCLWAAGSSTQASFSASTIALALLACLGSIVCAGARDRVTLLVAVEAATLPLFLLFVPDSAERGEGEGVMRWLVAHGAGTMLMAFGVALLGARSSSLELGATDATGRAGWLAAALVVGGLVAKLGAAPFDVPIRRAFAAAPAWAVALGASLPKVGLALALARVVEVLEPQIPLARLVLYGLAAASMILGLVGVLRERDLRGLLARSGALHVGFLLTALAAGGASGLRGSVVYALTFALPSLLLALVGVEEGTSRDDLPGLARRRKAIAWVLVAVVLSLIGVVPTIGFLGKLHVLSGALRDGAFAIAVLGALASVVSALPYGKLVQRAFSGEESPSVEREPVTAVADVALAAGAAATVALGVLLWPVLQALGLSL